MPCGYAPRALLASRHVAGRVVVGCKDASVSVIDPHPDPVKGGFSARRLPAHPEGGDPLPRGIRALHELGPDDLLVGRSDGRVDRLDTASGNLQPFEPPTAASGPHPRAVRSFLDLDEGRLLVAGDDRAFVVNRDGTGQRDEVKAQVGRALRPLDRVLLALRRRDRQRAGYLFATSRGEIWTWSGEPTEPALPTLDPWSASRRPAAIFDLAPMEREGAPPAVLLATDLGVYLIDPFDGRGWLRDDPNDLDLCRPLALPGLEALCMTLTYRELDGNGLLWASDTEGDSHLFWHAPQESAAGELRFLPSGVTPESSQVVIATAWSGELAGSVRFIQALRSDRIVVTTCWRAEDRPVGAGPKSDRELLRDGAVAELRARLAAAGADAERWPARAVLADFFELLATGDDGIRALRSFLSDPSAAVAHRILGTLASGQVGPAVRLWTLALLGVANRLPPPREPLYLGILRWLRALANGPPPAHREAIAEAVAAAGRLVHKWGLFGDANARRSRLARPLTALRAQLGLSGLRPPADPSAFAREPEALDLLTYEALLFHRAIDLIAEDGIVTQPGRTAWCIAEVTAAERRFVAVSWSLGGIELFELAGDPDGPALRFCWALRPRGDDGDGEPYEVSRDRHEGRWPLGQRYSRAVFVGRSGPGADAPLFLLAAPHLPVRPKGGGSRNDLVCLWHLALTKDGHLDVRPVQGASELPKGESIYRFLEIRPGLVVAGLRGVGGVARLAALRITAGAGSAPALDMELVELTSHDAGQTHGKRSENRIWSLARLERATGAPDRKGEPREVFAGCEGGEIWQLTVPLAHAPLAASKARLVARMSSSVRALAALRYGERKRVRLFAGGADGSIVAWQQIEVPAERPFASLWATFERGPITAIHPFGYGAGGDGERLVLALTRAGRIVLFDDRMDLQAPEPKDAPQRARVPGGRRGRRQIPGASPGLAGTSLASLLLTGEVPGGSGWDPSTGRFALLLTGSESGRLRLVSLHCALRTAERQAQHQRLLEMWWNLADVPSSREGLRLADATRRAVGLFPLVVVRWLLDPEPDGKEGEGDLPKVELTPDTAWVLPRSLRPLLALRTAWERLDAGAAAAALDDLLREAWRQGNLELFQEITRLSLKRVNTDLFRAATRSADGAEDAGRLGRLVLAVFRGIEEGLRLWVGAPERAEVRARIVVAKAMIDGDTLHRILAGAAREDVARSAGGRRRPRLFNDVLDRRIDGARQLLGTHDSLMTLETLRSMNLSLLRLCRRYSRARADAGRWQPRGPLGGAGTPSEQEAHWPVFARYFEEITYAAERAFRSPLELTDSLAHEYSRTFALTVCACPSAAIRIANRLTETRLIAGPGTDENELATRIDRQLHLLGDLGLDVPDEARQLFRAAALPPAHEDAPNPLDRVFAETLPARRAGLLELGVPLASSGADLRETAAAAAEAPEIVELVGLENAQDLHSLARLDRVVRWLDDVARGFAADPRRLDLSPASVQAIRHGLGDPSDHPSTALYAHSRGFLDAMLERLGERSPVGPPSAEIRPEIVLKSRDLADWAADELAELDRLFGGFAITQPQYQVFRTALLRVERAAREFPRSAAVQKSIALAIFGHHLLEDLDEHVFELEEIAQSLDPRIVWDFRDEKRFLPRETDVAIAEMSVAHRFADYLLRRAYHAESIPKNLRSLYGILESSQVGADARLPLDRHLLAPFHETMGWRCATVGAEETVSLRELQALHVVLTELDRNDRKYSLLRREKGNRPRVTRTPGAKLGLRLAFRFLDDDDNWKRLMRLWKEDLQEPHEPQKSRDVPSSGAGLYLANLAAAVVGWRLAMERPTREARRTAGAGGERSLCRCVYTLVRKTEDA